MQSHNSVNGIRPTLKPGQTLENVADKFGPWYESTGYYRPAPRLIDTFQTDAKLTSSCASNLSEFRKSFEATMELQKAQQMTAPRYQITKPSDKVEVLPVLKKSLSKTSFINIVDAKRKLLDFTTEDFEKAFFERAQYRGSTEEIDISDINHVVLGTLGGLTTEYILDKFTKMATSLASHRTITWREFSQGVSKILQVISEELIIGREKSCVFPTPKIIDKGLGSGYQLTSNYRENFLNYPNIKKPTLYNPDINPISKDKSILKQTSREIKPLYQGTPISVSHLPNYLGHIPKVISNHKKKIHAQGHAREMQNDLLLTQRGLDCVYGYAGHKPLYWTLDHDRNSGCDPRTTQGAAFGPERRML